MQIRHSLPALGHGISVVMQIGCAMRVPYALAEIFEFLIIRDVCVALWNATNCRVITLYPYIIRIHNVHNLRTYIHYLNSTCSLADCLRCHCSDCHTPSEVGEAASCNVEAHDSACYIKVKHAPRTNTYMYAYIHTYIHTYAIHKY